jgi:UDP:flavonoid glycosyltransferase YjiC (YdhE family)
MLISPLQQHVVNGDVFAVSIEPRRRARQSRPATRLWRVGPLGVNMAAPASFLYASGMPNPRSLRILLAAIGSRGDIQPMIALGQAASARGHRPVVAAPVNFGPWVQSCGLEYREFGVDMQKFLADNPRIASGGPLKTALELRRYGKEHLPEQVQQLRAATAGADLMLWAGTALMAPSVAEWAKVPALGVAYSTFFFESESHPPPLFASWAGIPRWLNRLLWNINRPLSEAAYRSGLQPARDELGLPEVSMHEHIRGGRWVVAADAGVLPDDPRWNGRYARANFIHYDDPRPLDPELAQWLDAGEPPVFAGFGSMNGPGPRRAAQAFIDAFAASGRRCLIGAGWAGLGGGALPDGWRVVGDVPHARLFPRVAAVVHHGGSGTMAAALRAGAPQVLLPLLMDQFVHRRRLHELGLAPLAVPMKKVSARHMAEAVDLALRLPAEPRREVAHRLQASDACGSILAMAESLCGVTREGAARTSLAAAA